MQNKSTVGYLAKQYRSILKKYFLISVGAYTLWGAGFAKAVDVTSFSALQSALLSADEDVNILNGINFSSALTAVSGVTINGDGNTFDGGTIYDSGRKISTAGSKGINASNYLTINNLTFQNFYFSFPEDNTTGGGALYAGSGLKITNSVFRDNYVYYEGTGGISLNYTAALGGALRPTGGGNTSIEADFYNNRAVSNVRALGGAIYFSGIIDKIKGKFENNGVINSKTTTGPDQDDAVAGAIGSYGGDVKLITGNFTNNYAIATGIAFAGGGAIRFASSSDAVVKDSIFTGNYASSNTSTARGGAAYAHISTAAKIYLIDSNFFDNYVKTSAGTANGGAIAAEYGSIYVVAKNNDVFFSGNYAQDKTGNKDYNAAYIESGKLYLTAATDKNIFFNDGIESNKGNIYIGSNITDYNLDKYTGDGNVIFNDTVSNSILNLSSGTIILGQENSYTNNTCTGSGCRVIDLANTTYFDNVTLNVTGGALSTINNAIQNTTISKLSLASDLNYSIDVSLANTPKADTLSITSKTGSKKIKLTEINVITNADVIGQDGISVEIADDGTALDISSAYITNATSTSEDYDDPNTALLDGNYMLGYNSATGELNFNYSSLQGAIKSIVEQKTYKISSNYSVTENLGALGGTSLAINGGGFNITTTSGANGISIGSGQELTLNNVGIVSGFFDAFVNATGGTININGATIQSAITGSADINITGNTTFQGGVNANTITNSGTTIFENNVTASIANNANITANNANITGQITGSGSITSTGTTSFVGNSIENNITIESDTTTFNGSTIAGAINDNSGTGNIAFTGTNTITGTITTSNAISNADTLNINSNLNLTNVIDGGTINLSADKILSFNGATAGLTNTTLFTSNGGIINAIDDNIRNHSLGTSELKNNSEITLDMNIDFADGTITADSFSGDVDGAITLSNVKISTENVASNVSGKTGFIEIFDKNDGANVSVATNNITSSLLVLSDEYTITLTNAQNGLDYLLEYTNNSLEKAINSIADPRIYIMTQDEIAGDASTMIGKLTINGDGNTITSGNITMQAGSDLTLNEVNVAANIDGGDESIKITGAGDYTYSGTIKNANINLNSSIERSNQDTNVSYALNSGTIHYTNDAFLNGGTNSLNFNGGNLNLINDIATNINLDSLTLNSNANLSLDVDLNAAIPTMDTLNATSLNLGSYKLDIAEFKVLSNGAGKTTDVIFTTNSDIANAVGTHPTPTTAYSSIFAYDVTYNILNGTDGVFTFTQKGGDAGFTDEVQTESVSNQTLYNTNIDFAKQMLAALDAYSPIQGRATGDEEPAIGGAWVKVYGSDEDVDLGSLDVDSKTYAGVLGVDASPEHYENGMRGIYSLYLAYLQSEQEYSGVNIEQNGINFGARAMFDKGNWFGGMVANLGFSHVEGTSSAGKEDFETYTASISLKTGYDINLHRQKYIMQPNITLSYLYAITPDYTNASDVKINSDALHAFNINPELKFIAHLNNGISPYASVGYNFNVEAGGEITADNIALPELSVDPYAEFKLGFTKEANKSLSGYVEGFATSGGRQGFGAQAGLKWQF